MFTITCGKTATKRIRNRARLEVDTRERWRQGDPSTLLAGTSIVAAAMEDSMQVPQKLEGTELLCNLAIPLLGTYQDKTAIIKDTRTPLFTATPFIIAKIRKRPICPSADE